MLHLVSQGFQQGTLPSTRGSEKEGHAARLDGSADVVQQNKSGLAGTNADEANERLPRKGSLSFALDCSAGPLL